MSLGRRLISTEAPEVQLFNTVLYTGNGSTQSITGVGFQPDFVWIKNRDSTGNHALYDSVRGVNKRLVSASTSAEISNSSFPSFDSDGFSLATNDTSSNANGDKFVSWCWKAGGSAVSNTDGTNITSQVSANTAAGFSIVTYTGATGSVGHGLDSTPQIIIQKRIDASQDWYTYIPPGIIDGTSNYYYLLLNGTDVKATTGSTPPTSTTFNPVSTSGGNYVAYCFHSVSGVSKIGSYTGDGTTSGKIITTGFEPSFLLTKPVGSTGGYWYILDNKRSTTNPRNDALFPNDNLAEIESTNYNVDFLSNGFELKNNTIGYNANNEDYIYMAFK